MERLYSKKTIVMVAALSSALAIVGVSFFGGKTQKTIATITYSETFSYSNQLWNCSTAEENRYNASYFGSKNITGHNPVKEAAITYGTSLFGTTTYSSSFFLLGATSGSSTQNSLYKSKIGGVAGFKGLTSVSGTIGLSAGYSSEGGYLKIFNVDWTLLKTVSMEAHVGEKSTFDFSWSKTTESSPIWFYFFTAAGGDTIQTSQTVLTLSSLTVSWTC
jgi:hypothetical protein